jgi:aminoglycoside phosphotransferase (APT) family kinase protein
MPAISSSVEARSAGPPLGKASACDSEILSYVTLPQVVELIREKRGLKLRAIGAFAGGEVGATDVRGDDGSRYVLKWWEGDPNAGRTAAILVEQLRDHGYPIPRFVVADDLGGVTVMLQEFVAGVVTDEVSDRVITTLLSLNQLQTAVGTAGSTDWTTYITGSLLNGCDGYCEHEPLRGYDRRTAALLDTIHAAGEAIEILPSGDAVHVDFHHRNVLVAHGAVSAVIDWEGCRSGDSVFDLVTLAFGLTVAQVSTKASDRVWETVRQRSIPDVRRAYVAHMALRQVDWSIRHRTAEDVDHWLRVSSDFLDEA